MQDHTSSSALENAIALQKFGVGQPVRRKEDDTLVRGKGKYTDDFNLPGQAYAWMVRSTHAHGIIRRIDTSAARTMPGVLGVWTGADLAASNYGPYTCGLPLKNRDGTPLLQTNRTALMTDKVRYVGDPVAFVVAETLAQARDAAEAVVVDIDPLPAVTEPEEAAKPGAPQLYDHIPNNVALDYHYGDTAKVEAAFASAAHVTKLDIVNTRVAVVAMEPRAGLASYDKASERYTIQVPTQGVAGNRMNLAKNILKVPNEKVHLLTPNVGGSFGMKNINYPEYLCILHAAKALDRPVKWTDERSTSFLSDSHGRAGQIRLRQSRRLYHRRRAKSAIAQRREKPGQRLSHAADDRRHQDGIDQHHADGGLSRRRASRGQLLHGAADRSRRRRNGHQPADPAQAQFHQAGANAVRSLVRRHL